MTSKDWKKLSVLPTLREMQIRTTLRVHLTRSVVVRQGNKQQVLVRMWTGENLYVVAHCENSDFCSELGGLE